MLNPDVLATLAAHSEADRFGYCQGLHLTAGEVVWPCEVYLRFYAVVQAERDAARRQMPRRPHPSQD